MDSGTPFIVRTTPAPRRMACLGILLCLTCLISLNASPQEDRKVLANPQPVYPELAKRMSLEGVVKVELIVGPDGQIKDSKVLGGHPILADAALNALRKWKYERARTESKIQVEFKFKSW